jgi:hypothetical protein
MVLIGIDWDEMSRGQFRPPFIPLTGNLIDDTRNFDQEFTKMSIKDGPSKDDMLISKADYGDFSFLDEEYQALRDIPLEH